MKRTVAAKMGLKKATSIYLVHAPAEVLESLGLPRLEISDGCRGEYGYIHVFVRTKEDLDQKLPILRDHRGAQGMLWVSRPKGRKLGTGLTLPVVIEVTHRHYLVESTSANLRNIHS